MSLIKNRILLLLLVLFFSQNLMAAEYKVAIRAHHGIDNAIKEWQPTLNVLSNKLPKHTFTLVPIVSLKDITQRAGRSEFDFVFTNPSSYVELEQLYTAKVIVTLNNERANTEQDRFGSVIFTHARNTNILTLKDLKDKTLMAVSESAFGGWRVAWLEMLEQGFNPHYQLKKLLFTKSNTQPEVVYAVRDGIVDVGIVRTDRLERMEAAGEIDMRYFRILNNKDVRSFPFFLSTKLYPEWAFAALKHVPEEDVRQVRAILMSITKDSEAARVGKYVSWIAPKDYSPVKNLMKRLKIGPYVNEE